MIVSEGYADHNDLVFVIDDCERIRENNHLKSISRYFLCMLLYINTSSFFHENTCFFVNKVEAFSNGINPS